MSPIKIIVERHPDAYVAYPMGIKGVVVGEGDSYETAVADLKSALKFHAETFGVGTLAVDPPIKATTSRWSVRMMTEHPLPLPCPTIQR